MEDVILGKIIREHQMDSRYFVVKIQMKRNDQKRNGLLKTKFTVNPFSALTMELLQKYITCHEKVKKIK